MGLLKLWTRWSLITFLLGAVCTRTLFGQDLVGSTNGPIRLWRNGVTSNAYTSGRVQLVVARRWGNICSGGSFSFGFRAASVVCRQLGYTGARDWSTAISDGFGTDTSPAVISDVDCFRSYLVILQCIYNIPPSSSCTDEDDVSVVCYSTRIWDNPYSGQVRLVGGSTVNQGLVEVYCNGQWGTVCNDLFTQKDADTICRQLGYSSAESYNHLPNRGISTQPIWLDNVLCTSAQSCITTCRSCPRSSPQNCGHYQDITVECYSLGRSSTTTETCTNANGPKQRLISSSSIRLLIVIACLILLCICAIFVPFCCCVAYYKKRCSGFTLRRAPNASRIQTGASTNTAQPSTQLESPAPAAFDLPQPQEPQQPVETVFADDQPGTDSTFTEAPPPAYDARDNYVTYTEKPDLPPPYQSPNMDSV